MSFIKDIFSGTANRAKCYAATWQHNKSIVASVSSGYREGSSSGPLLPGISGRDSVSEDSLLAASLPNMRLQALDLYRNSPLARSVVDGVDRHLSESKASASTSDAAWNKLATDYFAEWSKTCDVRGRTGYDFGMMQSMWSNCAYLMGDMLFAIHGDKLMPYEGVNIRTPDTMRGDKLVKSGVRVAKAFPHQVTHYYITSTPSFGEKQTFTRLAADTVFYAPARYWRPSMLRAAPDMHGSIDAMRQYNDTLDNIAAKVNVESRLISVETKGSVTRSKLPGKLMDGGTSTATAPQVQVTDADRMMRLQVDGSPDNFKLQDMKSPGSYFNDYSLLVGRTFAAGFGIPFEMVLHMWSDGSYTANRMAREDFKKTILSRWAWRNKVLNQPVYEWVIGKAISDGRLPPAPKGANGLSEFGLCNWSTPRFAMIDEGKEADADAKKFGTLQNSLSQIAADQQTTVEELLNRRVSEMQLIKTAADAAGVAPSELISLLIVEQQGDNPNE